MKAETYPRRKLFAWFLYDFGMASFSMVVITAFFVFYFKQIVAQGDPRGDFYWGLSTSIACGVVALISPFLGAVADQGSKKRPFFIFFASLAILATFALTLIGPGMVAAGMILFILGYIGYTAAQPFYNGFLPEIAPREAWPRVSGIGWGLGYVGGLSALLIIRPFLKSAVTPEGHASAQAILLITGAFFLFAALPAFFLLRDRTPAGPNPSGLLADARLGFRRLGETFRTVRQHPDLWKFLLAFFLFNDAITTVVSFFGPYAKDTLGFTLSEIPLLLLLVQVTAALGAFASGPLAQRIGLRRTVLLTLLIWIAVVLAAFLAHSKTPFWFVAIAAGAVLGGTQAAARTLVADLAPEGRKTEIFGFMATGGKMAAILGPALFGVISSFGGGQRLAILSVEFFFVAGFLALLAVKHK
ncbi:MAG: MFS transporter [Spirochaetes bacterium]|nr:MFS transporter [Spirochaetota bacterium]